MSTDRKILKFKPDVPEARPLIRMTDRVDAAFARERYNLPAIVNPERSSLVDARGRAYDSDPLSACADVNSFLERTDSMVGMPSFIGYASCANLSQDGLMRAGVEGLAAEMTREWIDVNSPNTDWQKAVVEELHKFKIRRLFRKAASMTGYFGCCRVFIDTGTRDPDELKTPLVLSKQTVVSGSLRGFIPIDPALMFPGMYNASDPISPWFYRPMTWYALGREIHASRFLHFIQNEPDSILLKPVYNFGGIPQVQIALDYLVHFTGTREAAARLLKKFSLTVFKTNMQGILYGEDDSDIIRRLRYFARNRDNDGVEVIDNEDEDILQINTPLSGVTDIVRQALEMLSAVFRMPVTKYLGISPGGMNATGESDMNNWYDYVAGQQVSVCDSPLDVVIKLMELNRFGDIDPALTYSWRPLKKTTEAEQANINKVKAETDSVLIMSGTIAPEESRKRLSEDADSGHANIDPKNVPPPPEGNIGEEFGADLP